MTLQGNDRRVAITAILSASWHGFKSYQHGNSSTELAEELCDAIERAAEMLGVEIEGKKYDQA